MSYPAGTTQAMHDRAHGSEDREPCETCDGTGNVTDKNAPYYDEPQLAACHDCNGTGYEPRIQAHERDFDPNEEEA